VVRCPVCGENLLESFLKEEARGKMVFKDRLYTILIFLVPFVIIELLIGIWSMMNHPGQWSIPPWVGMAFFIDLIILIIGILIAIVIIASIGYKPEKRAINAFVLEQKSQSSTTAGERLYSAGYGGGRTLGECADVYELGDVSIPDKAGVQRGSVIKVGVDRLTKTPQDSYLWVNPMFMKVLPSNKNPQPSTLEEMDAIWKASGRTMIGLENEKDEKLCSSCEKPLEYITEYDAWYCTSCGKYDEENEEDEVSEDGGTQDELPRMN
jgi:predicted RNA-binding Zn-ribbon protein involved in translation (DUF1610 family)